MGIYPNFVGPSYQLPSRVMGVERCMGWFPEVLQSVGNRPKAQYGLMPVPGVADFVIPSASVAPNRCAFSQDGRAFVIIGPTFYEVLVDGTLIARGDVFPGGDCTICSSGDAGNELFITSGGSAYVFSLLTGAFALIPNLVAHFGGFLGGRFLALDTNNSILRISDVFSGGSWNAAQFRQRTLASDRWKSMIVTRTVIFLVGSASYEVWWNSGAFPFPFEPVQGALFATGIGAPYSIDAVGETVMWMSGNDEGGGQVVMTSQYAPEIISNHAMEYRIQQAARDGIDISDAVSMTYQEDGHTFFVLTFRAADFTIVYDLKTGQWHERGYWNNVTTLGTYEAWRPLYHMYAFDKHLVGDYKTGHIYTMRSDLYSDVGGIAIRRLRVAPHLNVERDYVYYRDFTLDMQVGMGLSGGGVGSDPSVAMRYSDDGGLTWGNEIIESAGRIGESDTVVTFNRLGRSRDRVFEIVCTDPVSWRILGAYINGGPQIGK